MTGTVSGEKPAKGISDPLTLALSAVRVFETHVTWALVNRGVLKHDEAACLHLKCAHDMLQMRTSDGPATFFKEALAKGHDQIAGEFVSPEQLSELARGIR